MTDATAATDTVRAPSIDDLDRELANTRRMLESVPDAHWSWKPHEKSGSLGGLANHVVDAVGYTESPLRGDALDIAGEGSVQSPSRDELLRRFDVLVDALRAGVAEQEAQGWGGLWNVTRGDVVLATMPRPAAFRFGMAHLVHHRAQLSVYLRLLEVPVPGMYGPSADEHGA